MGIKAKKELAFGLDFGTTQSYLAYVPRDGKDHVQLVKANPNARLTIADQPTDLSMPSEVFLRCGDDGQIALEVLDRERDQFPADYVSLTRFKADLEKSREMQHRRQEYKLPPAEPGQPAEYVEPEAIAGFLMWRMRQLALKDYEVTGQMEGVEINNVTVTVPAESSSVQRKATQFAARLAGFESEVYTLEEPVAAFLYHYQRFFKQRLENRKDVHVLVFDFGGGTCDLSLIRLSGRNLPTVVGRRSARLGGEDIDELIARLWLKRLKLKDRPRFDELELPNQRYLRQLARTAKEQLSQVDEASISVGTLPDSKPGSKTDLGRRSLDRQMLADLLAREPFVTNIAGEPLREWTVLGLVNELVDSLLRQTGVDYSRVESIILAGGSSRLLAVREYLQGKFPTLGDRFISREPEASIAKGAALHQYYRHAGDKAMRKLVEPTLAQEIYLDHSFDYGAGAYQHSVILGKQNEPLPIERKGPNPLFISDATPVGNVVKIRLWQVGSQGRTTLLTDDIPVRSKDDRVLQVYYRITDYGTIENFKCLRGSLRVPPLITDLLNLLEPYEVSHVEEGEEYGSLLREYDLSQKNGRIRSLRDKYRINVNR